MAGNGCNGIIGVASISGGEESGRNGNGIAQWHLSKKLSAMAQSYNGNQWRMQRQYQPIIIGYDLINIGNV